MRTLGLKRSSSEIFVTTFATGASLFSDESSGRCPSDSMTSSSASLASTLTFLSTAAARAQAP